MPDLYLELRQGRGGDDSDTTRIPRSQRPTREHNGCHDGRCRFSFVADWAVSDRLRLGALGGSKEKRGPAGMSMAVSRVPA